MTTESPTLSRPLTILAFAGLALAVVGSGMLVLQHFAAMSLPGCGEGSGCAALTSGPWGKVPGIGLPVSFLGFAYFVAMTAELGMSLSRGPSRGLIWVVRLGAVASLFFLVIMFTVAKHFCPYCGIAHLGNLVFWIAMEFASGRTVAQSKPPVVVAAGVVFGCGLLVAGDAVRGSLVQEQGEQQRQGSTQQVIAGGGDETAFTGRWRYGPEVAPIRIVISSDYQCPDCKRIEEQARQILDTYGDRISLSAKHFPMCTDCNPHLSRNMHGNACWAARAAEAAGILHGNDGFWKMHFWLFDHKGSFTDAEIKTALAEEFGWDIREFLDVMQSPETLARVQADIEETFDLGLHYTPMVFVNGVELKGIWGKDALIRTVDEVAATNPEPKAATADRPPTALERHVADWREHRVPLRGVRANAWSRGPDDAPVDVVVWGDLEEPITGRLNRTLLQEMERRGTIRYRFMHYPVNQDCNPSAGMTKHDKACLAAKVAEASGRLGGPDAYWRAHDWLIENIARLDEADLTPVAAQAGVDPTALEGLVQSADIAQVIVTDGRAAKSIGIRSIPFLWVNGKRVPRWQREGLDVLGAILDEAEQTSPSADGRSG